MPDTTPNNVERDEAFRETMRQREDGPAKAWVALDDKALELDQQVGQGVREREGRVSSVGDLQRALNDARSERDDFRAENAQPGRFSSDRQAWDEQYQGLDNNVSGLQKEFAGALRDSSPEELDAIGKQIDERRTALAQTIAERQGIARLPREEGQEDLHDQVLRTGQDNMAARRAQQDQGQEQGEGEARGQGGSFRMRPNFGAYATTVEEENDRKRLEHDQRTVALDKGRPGTDAEMQAFEREGTERQNDDRQQQVAHAGNSAPAETLAVDAPTAKRGVQASSEGLQADLSVHASAAITPPLAELRAARDEKQAQAEHGQPQGAQRKRDWSQELGQGM
jgi:hypothetical protein